MNSAFNLTDVLDTIQDETRNGNTVTWEDGSTTLWPGDYCKMGKKPLIFIVGGKKKKLGQLHRRFGARFDILPIFEKKDLRKLVYLSQKTDDILVYVLPGDWGIAAAPELARLGVETEHVPKGKETIQYITEQLAAQLATPRPL